MTSPARRALAVATAGVLLLGVSGCTGDVASPTATPTTTPAAPPSGGSSSGTATTTPGQAASGSVEELTERVYGQATTAPVIGSVNGPFPRAGWPATVEVVAVQASATATVLRWRLRPTDGQAHETGTFKLIPVGQTAGYTDVRDVRLIDRRTQQYSLASLYVREGNPKGKRYCLCSDLPTTIPPAGVTLTGEYPALPATATEVDVAVPGLPVVKGVPVTRG